MAEIIKVKSSRNLAFSLHYGRDSIDKDTKEPKLKDELGINCDESNAINEFKTTRQLYGNSDNGVKLKQFILSFRKGEINLEGAHRYINDYLQKLNALHGGGWQMVAYAHNNTAQFHYHVYINNINSKTGKKYSTIYYDVPNMRKLNDELSDKYRLKPAPKKQERFVTKDMGEIKTDEKLKTKKHKVKDIPYSYQDHARIALSKAMLKANSLQDFVLLLNKQSNVSLRDNFNNSKYKNGTINIPFFKKNDRNHQVRDENGNRKYRKVRINRLGLAFNKKTILSELEKPINERKHDKFWDTYNKYKNKDNELKDKDKEIDAQPKSKPVHATDFMKDIPTNKFKTKKEIYNERAIDKIVRIRKADKRFEKRKSQIKEEPSTKSQQRDKELVNRAERQIKRLPKRESKSKGPNTTTEGRKSRTKSRQRDKELVDQARRKINKLPTRLSESNGQQISTQERQKQTNRQPSKYQQSINQSNVQLKIIYTCRGSRSAKDSSLLSKERQQRHQEHEKASSRLQKELQQCNQQLSAIAAGIRNFRKTEWKRLHRQLTKFYSKLKGYGTKIKQYKNKFNKPFEQVVKRFKPTMDECYRRAKHNRTINERNQSRIGEIRSLNSRLPRFTQTSQRTINRTFISFANLKSSGFSRKNLSGTHEEYRRDAGGNPVSVQTDRGLLNHKEIYHLAYKNRVEPSINENQKRLNEQKKYFRQLKQKNSDLHHELTHKQAQRKLNNIKKAQQKAQQNRGPHMSM